uniref:Uncharacterized protein n=1 Tax=Arundo donax TaxID=35708 RepID=A0A0A9DQZ3_ARUDO
MYSVDLSYVELHDQIQEQPFHSLVSSTHILLADLL